MNNFENKEFCKKCGGYCCIKSGCDYWVDDFDDKSYNGLLEVLATGDISVIALLNFKKMKDDNIIVVPFLGLRARNVDRDVIDLLSIKNTCSMLTEDGCTYDIEDRPSGGVNLIPGKNRYQCRPFKNPLEEMQKWESYQKQLRKVVKRYTGKSVEEKLKEDVENLFIAVFNGELENAAVEEQQDINNLLSILKRVYPSEYKKAVMSCFEDKKVMIKTKQSL